MFSDYVLKFLLGVFEILTIPYYSALVLSFFLAKYVKYKVFKAGKKGAEATKRFAKFANRIIMIIGIIYACLLFLSGLTHWVIPVLAAIPLLAFIFSSISNMLIDVRSGFQLLLSPLLDWDTTISIILPTEDIVGKVSDIGLCYTDIATDNGIRKVSNSIVYKTIGGYIK